MILYHFTTSPFARRVRLALAYKRIPVELRDARTDAEHNAELRRLNPLHTVPVLVDGERVVVDSTAICHYLERKYPEPPLWPPGLAGAEAFELTALVDAVLNILSDVGMRYAALHGDPNFPQVREVAIGRVQRALAVLAARVDGREFLVGGQWSAADMHVYTMVAWLAGLPARAESFAPVRAVVELGWSLPPALLVWAEQHRQRMDVMALG